MTGARAWEAPQFSWQLAGVVPDYALLPGGGYCDTAYYWRQLAPHAAR